MSDFSKNEEELLPAINIDSLLTVHDDHCQIQQPDDLGLAGHYQPMDSMDSYSPIECLVQKSVLPINSAQPDLCHRPARSVLTYTKQSKNSVYQQVSNDCVPPVTHHDSATNLGNTSSTTHSSGGRNTPHVSKTSTNSSPFHELENWNSLEANIDMGRPRHRHTASPELISAGTAPKNFYDNGNPRTVDHEGLSGPPHPPLNRQGGAGRTYLGESPLTLSGCGHLPPASPSGVLMQDPHLHSSPGPVASQIVYSWGAVSPTQANTRTSPGSAQHSSVDQPHEVQASTLRPVNTVTGLQYTTFIPALDSDVVHEYSQRIAGFWPHTTSQANEQFPEFCKLYQRIKSFNLPNALGAKITLSSGLHLRMWEHYLEKYHDREICAYLRYGWPVGFSASKPPVSLNHNHPSGDGYKDHVQDFITTELAHSAIIGPFSNDPFTPWMRKSPIMSRPKKDSTKRRIIIDLTFPGDDGVNGGIDIHSVLGRDISYKLPNIWDLTNHLKLLGPNAWIWKADLQRAYRQLRVDPLDCPLLGMQVDSGVFVDLCPSFGCRSSSAACQRTANAITYLMRTAGHTVYAYLDDFAGCAAAEQQAKKAYDTFIRLLEQLGLCLALEKCQAPVQNITWLGYQVDTRSMQVSVPPNKIQEIRVECSAWLKKNRVTKKALQSFIGKILHVAPCIRHARKFTARLLTALRNMHSRNWTTLDSEVKADIRWFCHYAESANGLTLYADTTEYVELECDACLTGAGGNSASHCYSWVFTPEHRQRYKSIHQLEALNILVALRTLAPHLSLHNKAILINTDNISSSFALTTGKTRDPVLAACAREIWLEGAVRDIEIKIVHKPGNLIPLADALSRMDSEHEKRDYAIKEIQNRRLIQLPPCISGYHFFDDEL